MSDDKHVNARSADEFDALIGDESIVVCRGAVVYEWLDTTYDWFEDGPLLIQDGKQLDPGKVYTCLEGRNGGLFIYTGGDEATIRSAELNAGGWMARPADFVAFEDCGETAVA